MRQTTKLPKHLITAFQEFLENHPPQEFSNQLRWLFMDYLERYIHAGFPLYFDEFIRSLMDLFELLDKAAAHQRAANSKEAKRN